MRIRYRIAAITLVSGLAAGNAIAQLSEQYADWAEGPVRHLITQDEERAFSRLRSDAEAQKFIDLFWARRDPTPATPQNEWKEAFDQRVALASERFTAGRIDGAVSDRGKVIILLGAPTRIARAGEQGPGILSPGQAISDIAPPSETWKYERDEVPEFLAGTQEMEIVFIDQNSTGQYRLGRSIKTDVNAAIRKAQQFYQFQPELAAVPSYTAPAALVPVPATETARTTFASQTLADAVRELRAMEASPFQNVYVTYGEYITAGGDYFVPVQIYMPKNDAVAAGGSMSFFGVIEDAEGNVVSVYEEPVTVAESKTDVYVDRSLELEPGEYTGTFGLAVNDKPVTLTTSKLSLEPLVPKEPSVSQLILSNNIYALTEPQSATDPYAFGGIKVVPKGDRTFSTSDELWYFVEIRNPGLAPAAAPPAVEGAAVAPEAEGKPKVQVGIQISGAKKMRSPLSEVDVQALKGVDGHYAIGSAIPLSGFPPGDYTMELKVIDTVSKKTWTLTEPFKVVP